MPAKAASIHNFFTARYAAEVANAHSNQKFFCFFFFKKRSAYFAIELSLTHPP
jgi:hypothetical protein